VPVADISELNSLLLPRIDEVDVVGIDEAQFFDASLVRCALDLMHLGKRVVLAGLDTTFSGERRARLAKGPVTAFCGGERTAREPQLPRRCAGPLAICIRHGFKLRRGCFFPDSARQALKIRRMIQKISRITI
jgi:Thymidine kinase